MAKKTRNEKIDMVSNWIILGVAAVIKLVANKFFKDDIRKGVDKSMRLIGM